MDSQKSIPLSQSMNSELYQVISSGDHIKFLSLINLHPSLLTQTTVQNNTVLHIAAAFNRKTIAQEITRRRPSILHATNSKGDTALHLAARLGSFQAAEHLIQCAAAEGGHDLEADDGRNNKELLRMANSEKDTALHDAVRNGHGEIVKLLVTECPELVACANGVGESPLFVAVEEDYLKIAQEIIKVDSRCLYSGRDGTNVFHAIIVRTVKRYTQNLIETPIRVYLALPVLYANHFLPEVLGLPYWERKITIKLRPIQKDLVEEVLSKFPNILIEADDDGWLPLHYAAYLGSEELVELILKHKPCMAYHKDNHGVSALHLAATEGCTAVLKTFAELCPDSCELLNSNDETALHVAVANHRAYAVRTMLLELASFRNLVNQQDKDGNTPLHLAAMAGDYFIVMMFVADGRVDKKIMNKAGFTTNDIIRLSPTFSWYEKSLSVARLEYNGALRGMDQVLARKSKSNQLVQKEEPKPNITEQETSGAISVNQSSKQLQKSKIWSEISDANLVVATIIATVTFSAAFQVPGGYQADGMAVLRKQKYFRLYLLSDALSFGFAAASMFVTFFTGLFGEHSGFSYPRRWVTYLTGISVWFLVMAFMLGTSAVMAEHSGFATLLSSVACVSFVWPVFFLGAVAVNWFTYFP